MKATARNTTEPTPRRRVRRDIDGSAGALARVERELAAGHDVKAACRAAGVSVPSYYRWRARLRAADAQPDRTRETILAAAKMVFLRDGYGASIESIAEAAQVARQTVYNQFGNKERLFTEIVQAVYQRVISPALQVERTGDLITTLTGFGRDFMRIAYDPENIALQRIALGEYRDMPELAKVAYVLRAAHAIPFLTDFIADYLRDQMDQGVIDRADPQMVAEGFVGSFTAYTRHRVLVGLGDKGAEWNESMLHLCVTIFARGLGYRNPAVRTADP